MVGKERAIGLSSPRTNAERRFPTKFAGPNRTSGNGCRKEPTMLKNTSPAKNGAPAVIAGLTLFTVLLWAINLAIVPPEVTTRSIIHEVFYVTGTVAWLWMALALVIAARPAGIERWMKTPLDALYLWHRRLGVAAIALSVVHWFVKSWVGPILTVLAVPAVPKPQSSGAVLEGFDAFWAALRPFSETSGLWLTVLMVALGLLSYLKRLGYARWLTTHKLFSVIFLVLSVHSVRLMDSADFLTPYGLLNIAITVVGCVASIVLLVPGAGRSKTVDARVVETENRGSVTLVTVETTFPIEASAGQFAFLAPASGAFKGEKHPFSIASVDGRRLVFAVKHLGDFTDRCIPELKAGDALRVEGPWGAFLPKRMTGDAVWIAAGIGVAPFLAWLEERANEPEANRRPAHLLWCVREKTSEPLLAEVLERAERAGVRVEVFESRGARFSPDALFAAEHPETVAVCAGEGLARNVAEAWQRAGGRPEALVREHFAWR